MKRSKTESQCFDGGAEKYRFFRSGINTQVRLPRQVFCTEALKTQGQWSQQRRQGAESQRGARITPTSCQWLAANCSYCQRPNGGCAAVRVIVIYTNVQ